MKLKPKGEDLTLFGTEFKVFLAAVCLFHYRRDEVIRPDTLPSPSLHYD